VKIIHTADQNDINPVVKTWKDCDHKVADTMLLTDEKLINALNKTPQNPGKN